MKRTAKLHKGSVLYTVIAVTTMMMVLISATIAFVAHTNEQSFEEYYSKQAYFTASSCLESFVAEVTKFSADGSATEDEAKANIEMLQRIAESGEEITVQITEDGGYTLDPVTDRIGTCRLKVEKNGSDNNLKATATAEYLGETESVTAYFTVKPLAKVANLNNAIELVGSSGAGYNNVEAYGNVTVSELSSHEKNILYDFTANDNKVSGSMTILGSMSVYNQFALRKNPLYDPSVPLEEGQSLGGSLTTSRSVFIVGNAVRFISDLEKKRDNNDEAQFNFVNAGELMLMGGVSGTTIGAVDKEVDIYASALVIGSLNAAGVPTELADTALKYLDDSGAEQHYTSLNGAGGQGQVTYGNIYTYDAGGVFNGDIYITGINNVINGDIYCSGDIYVYGVGNKVNGNIYLMPGKTIKGTGTLAYAAGCGANNVDWATAPSGRALRPAINMTSDTVSQYVYYPEHMMCSSDSEVSTISSTYKNFYDTDNKTIKSSVKDVTDFPGGNYDGVYYNHIVNESCKLSYLDNKKVLINVDDAKTNPDARNDIVILLQNGGSTSNQNYIYVKNSTDESDKKNERFCYFVSDAGVGTVNNEYKEDKDAGVVPPRQSTYDKSTFKTSSFNFGGSGIRIMDLDTYNNCSYSDVDLYLNLTNDTSLDGYNPGPSQIVFLITEGSVVSTPSNNSLIQASFFAPKAIINFSRGDGLKLQPYSGTTNVGVLGMVIANQFNTSANNVGVFFQEASENCMISSAKGSDSVYTSGFKLVKYSNY